VRSEIVFRAQEKVANRYLLCQKAAKTTRRLHFASMNTTDAITDALVRMADGNWRATKTTKEQTTAFLS
jgi:hypothetical protein